MIKHPEFALQVRICRWLEYNHPKTLFMSDTIANLKLTISQATRNKMIQKNDFHVPDLIIFEPNEKYKGLFVELKKESPYKKDGGLKMQKVMKKTRGGLYSYNHLEAQENSMKQLRSKGYYATFIWSFEDFQNLFNDYLKNRLD